MRSCLYKDLQKAALGTLVAIGGITLATENANAQVQIPTDIVGQFECVQTRGRWHMVAVHAQFPEVNSNLLGFTTIPGFPAQQRCATVSAAFNNQIANRPDPVVLRSGVIPVLLPSGDAAMTPVLCAVSDPALTCNNTNQLVTLPLTAINGEMQDTFVSVVADHFRYLDSSPLVHRFDPFTGTRSRRVAIPPSPIVL